MKYQVDFTKQSRKQFDSLPSPVKKRILKLLLALEENPQSSSAKKLSGQEGIWRVRVGDYRVIYEIQGERLVVLVLRVGHRREVYRCL